MRVYSKRNMDIYLWIGEPKHNYEKSSFSTNKNANNTENLKNL